MPDGRLVTVATYTSVNGSEATSTVTIWNLNDFSSKLFTQIPAIVRDITLTLNGTVLALATLPNCNTDCNSTAKPEYDRGSIWLFHILTRIPLYALGDTGLSNEQDLTDYPGYFHTDSVLKLQSISDVILASASRDGTVKLWNLTSLEDSNPQTPVTLQFQFTSTRTVNTMITSDGSPLLFAGSHNGLIGEYSLKQGDTYGNLMSSYNSGLDVTSVHILNEPS